MNDLMTCFRAATRRGPFCLGDGDPDLRFRPVVHCTFLARQGAAVRALVARVARGELRNAISHETVPGAIVLYLWEGVGDDQFTVRSVTLPAGAVPTPPTPPAPVESAWDTAARVCAGTAALFALSVALIFELPWWLVALDAALVVAMMTCRGNTSRIGGRKLDTPRRPIPRRNERRPVSNMKGHNHG